MSRAFIRFQSSRRARVLVGRVVLGWLVVLCVTSFLPEYPRERLSYDRIASTRFFAKDGTLLFERRSEQGGYATPVELDRVSEFVVQATLAGEDANFRRHLGVDPLAVARASWLNLRAGRLRYGGSTITQQLAKLLDREPRTLIGKVREALAAFRLEQTLGKDEILSQYLNRAYYGRNAYGIEAAAQRFFGKGAAELALGEATLLAILPRSPNAYDPERFPERAMARRAHVLSLMVGRGLVTEERAREAQAAPIVLATVRAEPKARHAVDHLMQHVTRTGDVTTSLDLELQTRLGIALERHLLRVRGVGAEQAAILVIENDGVRISAMLGSRDYEDALRSGAVNATLSRRPAGSTLKPFLYGMAFERGASPHDLILDQPTTWADYTPRNTHDRYRGWVSLEWALGSSSNVPAVALLERLGVGAGAARLAELGFEAVDPTGARHGLALALGAVPVSLRELGAAYAALANDGELRPASLVADAITPRRVFPPEVAREVTRTLANAGLRRPEFGLETPLDLPFEVAAKTGTSAAFCDNWTVGYTREVTVAVWVGNFSGRPLQGALAMRGAAPLFHDAMFEAMRGRRGVRELMAHDAPAARGTAGPAPAPELRIASPRAGSRFLVDPLLPASTQRIALRLDEARWGSGAPTIARVEWQLDDEPVIVVEHDQFTSIALVPGAHRLRARVFDRAGALLAESSPVVFEVIGVDDV